MPELPEVETTRRRLEPLLVGKKFERVEVRTVRLRQQIPPELGRVLPGKRLISLERRGKYLLFYCGRGCLVIHLGMSGFLRYLSAAQASEKHDHLDFVFADGGILRLSDPRKFGTVLWVQGDPLTHSLLARIGPEPLTDGFDGTYLFDVSRSRRIAVKTFIMTAGIVAGVGNIYANEALFRARIRPDRQAGSLDRCECDQLAVAIQAVLAESIDIGSTWRVAEDDVSYHALDFNVYGRSGAACRNCGEMLTTVRLGNRSTVFCPICQM